MQLERREGSEHHSDPWEPPGNTETRANKEMFPKEPLSLRHLALTEPWKTFHIDKEQQTADKPVLSWELSVLCPSTEPLLFLSEAQGWKEKITRKGFGVASAPVMLVLLHPSLTVLWQKLNVLASKNILLFCCFRHFKTRCSKGEDLTAMLPKIYKKKKNKIKKGWLCLEIWTDVSLELLKPQGEQEMEWWCLATLTQTLLKFPRWL